MAKHVSVVYSRADFERLQDMSKHAGTSFSFLIRRLVRAALSDGVSNKLQQIIDKYYEVNDKVVVSISMDDDTYNELLKLSMRHNVSLSSLVRALSLYAYNNIIDDEVWIKTPKPSGIWAKFDFTELTAYLECKNGHRLLELALGQDMYKVAKTLGQFKIKCAICGSNTLYIHVVPKNKREVAVNARP